MIARHNIKIADGPNDKGAEQRGIQLAYALFDSGLWNGVGELWLHDAYGLHTAIYGLDALPLTALSLVEEFDGVHVRLSDVEAATENEAPPENDDVDYEARIKSAIYALETDPLLFFCTWEISDDGKPSLWIGFYDAMSWERGPSIVWDVDSWRVEQYHTIDAEYFADFGAALEDFIDNFKSFADDYENTQTRMEQLESELADVDREAPHWTRIFSGFEFYVDHNPQAPSPYLVVFRDRLQARYFDTPLQTLYAIAIKRQTGAIPTHAAMHEATPRKMYKAVQHALRTGFLTDDIKDMSPEVYDILDTRYASIHYDLYRNGRWAYGCAIHRMGLVEDIAQIYRNYFLSMWQLRIIRAAIRPKELLDRKYVAALSRLTSDDLPF